ncbi:hypothetical protein ATO7_10362 [Oceanococcus atlanticus]|uniref:YggT family protein n=1 Tax=Oceanococcus atlanticus TaxID=1317117 RepID=A0A1Y1SEL3_9GAMM|nr:YggT family protein [Oceanococcus atlanticus]ORE87438.1 hypothetical protein ATO7_10362 [Oceanococcus atlanticus]
MTSNIDSAGLFLVNTLFSLYAYTLILRILLQWVRADFYNPMAQFVWKVTNPPTQLLRQVVPRYRQLDIPALVVLLAVVFLNILVDLLIIGRGAGVVTILWISLLKVLTLTINLMTITILVQAVMSWFGASMHSPASSLLFSVNEPMLRPVRRVLPPIGGLDLSPLVVILVLQVLIRLIPLPYIFR